MSLSFKRMLKSIRNKLRLGNSYTLDSRVLIANDLDSLMQCFGWSDLPIILSEDVHGFEYIQDLNQRRLRDAESLGVVCRNVNRGIIVEIGTSTGRGTALMAENAVDAQIHTVNIPPAEARSGKGGKAITWALEESEIGHYYRAKGLNNVTQILANTLDWEPKFDNIEVCFIDGCHDTEFVINDTLRVLKHMSSGSFILWHDFNPSLRNNYHWIDSVCTGVEDLILSGDINGPILHLKDSWIGIYQVK